MNDRQKKGIGFFISAGMFALAGGVLMSTAVTPAWVDVAMTIVSLVSSVFGIVVTAKPDTK